jgi:hypothetical protein
MEVRIISYNCTFLATTEAAEDWKLDSSTAQIRIK